MAEPLATASDVAAALVRPLTSSETSYADGLIASMSAVARRKIPRLDEYIAAGTVDPDLAAFAVARAVRRILLNPESASQHSESVGPFVESITHSTDTRTDQFVFTDEELSWMSPANPPAFGTIMTAPGLEQRGVLADYRWRSEWERFQAARR
jgi:hypothetical protein